MQALRLPEPPPSGVDVWCLNLDLRAPLADADWAILDDDEKLRLGRLRRHEDRVRGVVARATLRRLLGSYLRRAPSELRFAKHQHGKSYLQSDSGSEVIDFSLSHSGDCVLIAISRLGVVGVDIECCDPNLDVTALELQVLSPLERFFGVARQPDFYQRWVAKEAVLKAVGVGVAVHLQRVSVWKRCDSTVGRLGLHTDMIEWPPLDVMTIPAPVGYAAALAWQS